MNPISTESAPPEFGPSEFAKVGLITKRSDPRALEACRWLVDWLGSRGIEVTISDETAQAADIPEAVARRRKQAQLAEGQDLVLVLGGDGTFINACRLVGERQVPLMGINMGRLGFLTEVPREDMAATLSRVLAGEHQVEERMMLTASVLRESREVLCRNTINDVVIHKEELARMIEFDVAIDDEFVFTSRADGLIVATPTGSTGYSLSAGGPIIHPALDAILLVPICPHTLTNRPLVAPSQGTITVSLAPSDTHRLVTLDGQIGFPLQNGDRILIRRSDHVLRVLHAPGRSYYGILRNKLLWGEKLGSERCSGASPSKTSR